nr:proline-rich proteoglycan 2-like [Manis javanica]
MGMAFLLVCVSQRGSKGGNAGIVHLPPSSFAERQPSRPDLWTTAPHLSAPATVSTGRGEHVEKPPLLGCNRHLPPQLPRAEFASEPPRAPAQCGHPGGSGHTGSRGAGPAGRGGVLMMVPRQRTTAGGEERGGGGRDPVPERALVLVRLLGLEAPPAPTGLLPRPPDPPAARWGPAGPPALAARPSAPLPSVTAGARGFGPRSSAQPGSPRMTPVPHS